MMIRNRFGGGETSAEPGRVSLVQFEILILYTFPCTFLYVGRLLIKIEISVVGVESAPRHYHITI